MENLDENLAVEALEKGYEEAKELLANTDKMDAFLQKAEKQLGSVPVAGSALAIVPTMISLVKSYVKKEYSELPIGSIIAVVSSLIYWLKKKDLIPDRIPIFGKVDDVAVIAICTKLVKNDIENYEKWRNENNKVEN